MIGFKNALKEGDVIYCWNTTEGEPETVLVVPNYPRPDFGYAKISDGSLRLVLSDDETSDVLFYDKLHLKLEKTGALLEVNCHQQDGSIVQDFGPTS
tara:strand:+ start:3995 stop:4285 length:291 start_codon:yes stop_codon:yes gene_type:complete